MALGNDRLMQAEVPPEVVAQLQALAEQSRPFSITEVPLISLVAAQLPHVAGEEYEVVEHAIEIIARAKVASEQKRLTTRVKQLLQEEAEDG